METPTGQVQENVETQNSKPKQKRVFKIVGLVILAVLILLGATVAWLYYSPASDLKSKVMKKLSYPLILVNGKPISYTEVARRYEIAKKGSPSIGSLSDPEVGSKILSSLVENSELEMMAEKHGVGVNSQDLDSLYDKVADTTTGGDKNALSQMLERMGVNTEEFKQDILRPQAIVTNLAVWYNEQKQLNEQSYKKMDEVQQSIAQGKKFEDLAQAYSEDTSSKDLEGDMGDIDLKTILPELSAPISQMNTGDIKLIPSRYGLHLVKVEGKNDQTGTYHIKQIFVRAGEGFQDWYDQQRNSYRVMTLVKHF